MSEQIQETTATNSLLNSIWGVEPEQTQVQQTSAEAQSNEPIQNNPEQQPAVQTQEQNQPTTPDYNSWVKETFGVDSVEEAKQKWEEVKNFKPEEPKYKSIDELLGEKEQEIFNHLANKQKLERLSSASLDNDPATAAEIIKLSMKQKNSELTPEDAEFLFNEKYNIPSKPSQSIDDTEEEYENKLSQWQEQVSRINRQMIIEAKMAKPELEKLKTELKYPEIVTQTKSNEPSQEELAKLDEIRNWYLSTLNTDYSKFEGFNAPFKDEEVEFTVPFVVSDEEKAVLKAELENFDADAFFGNRWFNKEGKPNVNQMMSDLYLLQNTNKVFQKIANEAGSQRLEHKIKRDSNLTVNGNNQDTFRPNQKSEQERLLDSIWNN